MKNQNRPTTTEAAGTPEPTQTPPERSNRHALDQAAQDPRLSLRAKGLLTVMLASPTQEHAGLRVLTPMHRDSRLVAQGALRELLEAGYITHHQPRDEHGRLTAPHYQLAQPQRLDHKNPGTRR